uniref:glucuronosyltransferase n=1 Tax=Strongyloides papillosus TaxID=174720 RepID=A0A0N5BF82_STREA
MISKLILVYYLTLFSTSIEGLKILAIAPQFGISHVRFTGNAIDILAKAGHDVTFLLPSMDPETKITGTKLAKIITTDETIELTQQVAKIMDNKTSFWERNSGNLFTFFSIIEDFQKSFEMHCERLINNDTLTEIMRNEKFDLGVVEIFDYCAFGLFKLYNIPAHVGIIASSLPSAMYKHVGLTYPIAQLPELFTDFGDNEMTFFNRLKNLFGFVMGTVFSDNLVKRENKLFEKKYGKNFVDIPEQIRDCSFLIVNSNPFADNTHPTLSKIIEIGGFAMTKSNILSKEWDDVMSRKKHTILVSFGSVAKSYQMPIKMKDAFIKAFKELPDVTFIWKYEEPNDPYIEKLENLYLSKWVPQTDLLNDKRLTGFLTHSGQNSLQEAAYYGVPLICLGIFADQNKNAKIAEKLGFGSILSKQDAYDHKKIVNAFKKLLTDDNEYKKNGKRISDMIKSKPGNITQTFIDYVEFAGKFKKLPHLNMEGHKLNIFQYALLDVILFLLAVILTTLIIVGFIVFKTVKMMYVFIFGKKQKVE